ncbi:MULTISPECIES: restriction endonuclease [Brucella]|uniref:restriction endonuclease n=1 Tax=Brucella TaxID=234 RepID=UPI001F3DC524|nr:MULTISPECIES: restriction endonuclease [Brucella]
MKEASTVAALANLLYDFLPGSGNNMTAFPLAAQKVGVAEFWPGGSKLPAVTQLLTLTLERRRGQFCPLILEVVKQSMTWRGKREPLTRAEIDQLNTLLPGVGFKIPDLLEPTFLATLPGSPATASGSPAPATPSAPDAARLAILARGLLDLNGLAPQERGFAFERFLHGLFDAYGLMPRASFRPRAGEQIDGSFELDNETYLLEAKWKNEQTPAADLLVFAGKLASRPSWSRGLFISYSGFSVPGLDAFHQARSSIICMDGFDLHETLSRQLPFERVIARKARRAVETGHVHVPVRDLFP